MWGARALAGSAVLIAAAMGVSLVGGPVWAAIVTPSDPRSVIGEALVFSATGELVTPSITASPATPVVRGTTDPGAPTSSPTGSPPQVVEPSRAREVEEHDEPASTGAGSKDHESATTRSTSESTDDSGEDD